MEFDADIFDAVEFGDLATVKNYWKDSININYQDLNGMDLLMVACSYGHINIVTYLLDHKPNLLNRNIKGKTALNIATQNGFEAIVRLLN
tara:strand:- start:73 stop:342 length:270 start_codon:yes stop_codon:yes gene_type:complete